MSDDSGQQASLDEIVNGYTPSEGEEDDYSAPDIAEEVPEDWEIVTVEDLNADLLGGGTPSKSNDAYWGGEIPWASVKDLDGITLSETEDYITQEGLDDSASNLIPSHSIVISTRMTVGEPFVNLTEMAINQDMKGIIPDENLVNTYYFVYNLRKKDPYLKSLGRGTTVDGITTVDLERTHIELPPLDEQRKIASILYNVDKAIRKTEEIVEQSKRVKKGMMQDIFTEGYYEHENYKEVYLGPKKLQIPNEWEFKEFDKFATKVRDGPHITPDYVEEGIPFVSSQNVSPFRDEFDFESYEKCISEETYKEINKNCRPEKGDLLISRRATIGPTQLVRSDKKFGYFVGVAIIKTDEQAHNPYLEQLLNWSEIQKLWHAKSPGSTMNTLNLGTIKAQKVPLPPIEEQEKIAESLYSIDRVRLTSEKKKDQLNRLKRGLMQDLLTGKVRTTSHSIDVLPQVENHG